MVLTLSTAFVYFASDPIPGLRKSGPSRLALQERTGGSSAWTPLSREGGHLLMSPFHLGQASE